VAKATTWFYRRHRRRDARCAPPAKVGSPVCCCYAPDFPVHADPAGFTYQDSDLLLVLRKTGNNDLLFNLGRL